MRSLKIVALFLLVMLNQNVFGQYTVSGTLTSGDNKQPLRQVSVYIPELQRGVISDESGKYSLTNLPGTTLNLQFSQIGYKTQVSKVNTLTTTSLDIELEKSVTSLEEVLVTSDRSKLAADIPFSVSTLTRDDIRKYQSPSLMGNLSYQPGIDKISIGNGIGKPVIRGLSFNQIMLYTQGTRVENQQWDDHHDLGISDIGIEQTELVRGPAALIYGADALGGALIFTHEKTAPTGTTVGDVNLGFNSNTLGVDLDAGVKGTGTNGIFYGIRFGGQSHTSYLQGTSEEGDNSMEGESEEFAPNSKFMNGVGKVNVGVSKKWGVSKISYSYFKQQIGIIEDESMAVGTIGNDEQEQRDREMEAPYQDVSTQIVAWENTILLGKSKINFNLAEQVNDRKEYEPLPNKQKELAIGLKLNVFTYDLKWTSNAEKELGFTVGSQGTFLKNENNGKESLVPNADVSDIAGYALLRYDHKKLNLLGGLRFDARTIKAESYENNGGIENETYILYPSNDTIIKPETEIEKDYSPISFSLGAAYHLNSNLVLKLNGATGFTAPNYAQLGTFGKHEGTYRFERGDANLKVEQNQEGDLGLSWANQNLTIDVDGYVNSINNYIYIVNTGDSIIRITPDVKDTLPVYDYKQGDATISGGEFGIAFHPASIKWLNLHATYGLVNGKLNAGGNLPYIPSNKIVGELMVTREKLWKFTRSYISMVVSNYSKQKNVTDYELSTDGYTLLDLHVGGSFKMFHQQASINIYCNNLLNTGYYNQLSLVKYIGVKDMGRSIGFSLHVPFSLGKS